MVCVTHDQPSLRAGACPRRRARPVRPAVHRGFNLRHIRLHALRHRPLRTHHHPLGRRLLHPPHRPRRYYVYLLQPALCHRPTDRIVGHAQRRPRRLERGDVVHGRCPSSPRSAVVAWVGGRVLASGGGASCCSPPRPDGEAQRPRAGSHSTRTRRRSRRSGRADRRMGSAPGCHRTSNEPGPSARIPGWGLRPAVTAALRVAARTVERRGAFAALPAAAELAALASAL